MAHAEYGRSSGTEEATPYEANRTRHDQRAHQLRRFTHRGSEAVLTDGTHYL